MRILIVNDDGIKAPGIRKLAELSMQLGEVWVVAPKSQCSAMSQRITLFEDIEVTPESQTLYFRELTVVITLELIFFTRELSVRQWKRLQMASVHLLFLTKMIQAGRLQTHILFRL